MSKAPQNTAAFTQCSPFCRPVVAAANSLAELAAAAAAALVHPGNAQRWLLWQVDAGCAALASCVLLACYAQRLSGEVAYRLGAACRLVLGPGLTVLEHRLAAAQQQPPAAAALRITCFWHSQVVTAALEGMLLPERQPQAAAAFASSVANPAALLPWLATLSRAVPFVAGTLGQGE